MEPDEGNRRAHSRCGSQRDCEVQGDTDCLTAQPEANGGDSVTGAERDHKQKCMPHFLALIGRKQVRNRNKSNCPWKDEHRYHRPKRPHVFPLPAIHESRRCSETSVEYTCAQCQCGSARGCDK